MEPLSIHTRLLLAASSALVYTVVLRDALWPRKQRLRERQVTLLTPLALNPVSMPWHLRGFVYPLGFKGVEVQCLRNPKARPALKAIFLESLLAFLGPTLCTGEPSFSEEGTKRWPQSQGG